MNFTMSDEEILRRSQKEPWLFAMLLDRYQDAFLRKVRKIIFNEQDTEEIVQDTFTKIYLNSDQFFVREGASFSSWAYRILLNTAFTRYQKLVKEGKRFTSIDPDFEQMIGESILHSAFEEDRDLVERILDKMPGHLATVLRLHYIERWSHKDIAKQTGEKTGTVKARIHRAKEAFRNLMDK